MFSTAQAQSAGVLRPPRGSTLVGHRGIADTVARTVASKLNDLLTIYDFGAVGDGVTDDTDALVTAGNSGKMVLFPDGVYLVDSGVLNIGQNVAFIGLNVPLYDAATGWKAGAWIKSVVGISGALKSVAFKNLGLDTTESATTEGLTITNSAGEPPVENVFVENVIVIGKETNNHNMLIENANNVFCKNITTRSGIQGVAVKATNFYLEDIKGIDCITWSLTLRESAGAICRHGTVRRVRTVALENPTCGGVVLMNSTEGEEASDILFDDINLDKGYFFIDNTVNSVGAKDIRLNNLVISGRSGFALQTFGPVDGFKVTGAVFNNCGAGFFTNGGDCKNYELDGFTFNGTPVGAQLDGSNHIARGWKKGDTGPGTFILNYSTDLQVYDMDARAAPYANAGGGTALTGGGVVIIPQIGSLPEREWRSNYWNGYAFGSVEQNDFVTLYTLPSSSSKCCVELTVTVFSIYGTHIRRVLITNDTKQDIGASVDAAIIFEVDRSSDLIRMKYIAGITSDLYVVVTGSVEHEAP